MVTDKYPEYAVLRDALPNGTVLDGEILPWRDDMPLPFQLLQTRIGRKTVSQRALKEAPVALVAYDLLEWEGNDLRSESLAARRALLKELVQKIDLPVLGDAG